MTIFWHSQNIPALQYEFVGQKKTSTTDYERIFFDEFSLQSTTTPMRELSKRTESMPPAPRLVSSRGMKLASIVSLR